MLARIRKARENDEGFTLIELLVVIIIIGILAAIAIPTFLKQREKGWEASAKSDLRNAATAQESYFTEASAYTTDKVTALPAEGFNASGSVVLEVPTATTSAYVMCAEHGSGGRKFVIRSGSGTIATLARGTACPTV